jgi:hypothetical protein
MGRKIAMSRVLISGKPKKKPCSSSEITAYGEKNFNV